MGNKILKVSLRSMVYSIGYIVYIAVNHTSFNLKEFLIFGILMNILFVGAQIRGDLDH